MANAGYTVKVEGLRELIARGDTAIDKSKRRLVREGLRDAVQPVRAEASRLFNRYDPKSASNYKVVVRRTGAVAVEQRLRKTTGLHPEFSRLQMREALLPGFEHARPAVLENLQKQLDILGREFVGT